MPIVSSVYTLGNAQANGLRRLTIVHTWDDGGTTEMQHSPANWDGVDLEAMAAAQAANLEAQAADLEFEGVLGGA